uniref:C-type lectin domain-containing protein n=1 Tax=Romanomermis culicivorax TaxID=13658 RepID=A0A915INX3_ROMCU
MYYSSASAALAACSSLDSRATLPQYENGSDWEALLQFISTKAGPLDHQQLTIAVSRINSTTWSDQDGTWLYSDWYNNQPDTSSPKTCITMTDFHGYEWSNSECTGTVYAVCQLNCSQINLQNSDTFTMSNAALVPQSTSNGKLAISTSTFASVAMTAGTTTEYYSQYEYEDSTARSMQTYTTYNTTTGANADNLTLISSTDNSVIFPSTGWNNASTASINIPNATSSLISNATSVATINKLLISNVTTSSSMPGVAFSTTSKGENISQ